MNVIVMFQPADGGDAVRIETIFACSPQKGMRFEFYDSDRDQELAGEVELVTCRDLDGDVDVLVYVKGE